MFIHSSSKIRKAVWGEGLVWDNPFSLRLVPPFLRLRSWGVGPYEKKTSVGSLTKSVTCVKLRINSFFFFDRAVLFHMFDKETIGSNNSLGQVNIELKYLDLDEPIRKRYPLADLVSSLFFRHFGFHTTRSQNSRYTCVNSYGEYLGVISMKYFFSGAIGLNTSRDTSKTEMVDIGNSFLKPYPHFQNLLFTFAWSVFVQHRTPTELLWTFDSMIDTSKIERAKNKIRLVKGRFH